MHRLLVAGAMEKKMYNQYENSVGNNLKHVQLTTKYRLRMMRKPMLNTFCKVAIEEACKKHKITVMALQVMDEHVHMIVDCPRTFSDSKLMQLIKGLSSYLMFRLCPDLRKAYRRGSFWSAGYFCCSIGAKYELVLKYIEEQTIHHH